MWPGFGENMRVLEWIVNRAKGGKVMGIESPIGWMPRYRDINWDGIEGFSKEDFTQAMSIDKSDWDKELLETDELFIKLYDPPALYIQLLFSDPPPKIVL